MILNFQTLFFKVSGIFSFFQIQLKFYMLAENMLTLSAIKFHVAAQPLLKFMID